MKNAEHGWVCYACRKYASDVVKIVNKRNGDYIFMHPSCIAKALEVMPAPKERRREGRPESGRSGRRRIGAAPRREVMKGRRTLRSRGEPTMLPAVRRRTS